MQMSDSEFNDILKLRSQYLLQDKHLLVEEILMLRDGKRQDYIAYAICLKSLSEKNDLLTKQVEDLTFSYNVANSLHKDLAQHQSKLEQDIKLLEKNNHRLLQAIENEEINNHSLLVIDNRNMKKEIETLHEENKHLKHKIIVKECSCCEKLFTYSQFEIFESEENLCDICDEVICNDCYIDVGNAGDYCKKCYATLK